ncbi:MAG: RNA polymerase sigma factor [Alphaproteobacteria bacterium]
MSRKDAIARELPHLRRYARALVRDPVAADDLVQDCVLRGLEKIAQWQVEESPRLWLFTIMHNLFVDQARAHQRRSPAVLPAEHIARSDSEQPRQVDQMIVNDVVSALQVLPPERREAVVLVGVEGFSYRDAAAVMGVPVGTLMSRLARGRAQLRTALGESPGGGENVVSMKR